MKRLRVLNMAPGLAALLLIGFTLWLSARLGPITGSAQ